MKRKARPKRNKELYIIAGPNGSGKTTFARQFLPKYVGIMEFVNADLIASGISPFAPEVAGINAGRVMLARISELVAQKKSFGFETTLAGRTYLKMLSSLKKKGYRVHLYFLWLPNAKVAIQRVAQRVRKGGHNIPEDVIKRRFTSGLRNLFDEYLPVVDAWILWDASTWPPRKVASGAKDSLLVENESRYNEMIATKTKKPNR